MKEKKRELFFACSDFFRNFFFFFIFLFRVSEINGNLEFIINYSINEYQEKEVGFLGKCYFDFIKQIVSNPEIKIGKKKKIWNSSHHNAQIFFLHLFVFRFFLFFFSFPEFPIFLLFFFSSLSLFCPRSFLFFLFFSSFFHCWFFF